MLPPLAEMFRNIHDARNGYKSYPVDYLTPILRAIAMVSLVVLLFLAYLFVVWYLEIDIANPSKPSNI